PGRGQVGGLHQRVHHAAYRAGGGRVRLRVAYDELVSLLLKECGRVAVAYLGQRGGLVLGLADFQHLVHLATGVGRQLLDQRYRTDQQHVRFRRAAALEQPTEDNQEDQWEEDGEEQRGPVPPEAQEHRPGQGDKALHARYSRPVR